MCSGVRFCVFGGRQVRAWMLGWVWTHKHSRADDSTHTRSNECSFAHANGGADRETNHSQPNCSSFEISDARTLSSQHASREQSVREM